jgi:hypothetical protein
MHQPLAYHLVAAVARHELSPTRPAAHARRGATERVLLALPARVNDREGRRLLGIERRIGAARAHVLIILNM